MKTLAAFSLAFALIASSAITLRAQDQPKDRDRGPSVYKSGETITGEVSSIDMATKTIQVKPTNSSNTGISVTLDYLAKDSTELAKFHVGDVVTGKVSKDNPPKLTNLKSSNKLQGSSQTRMGTDSTSGATGVRDSARTGGMGSPR